MKSIKGGRWSFGWRFQLILLGVAFLGAHWLQSYWDGQQRQDLAQTQLTSLRSPYKAQPLLAAKLQVINFWASWCGVCQQETPQLQKLAQSLDDEGVAFMGLASYDDTEAARADSKLSLIPIAMLDDAEGIVAQQFGVNNLPQTILVDDLGRVLWRHEGKLSQSAVLALTQRFAGKSSPE